MSINPMDISNQEKFSVCEKNPVMEPLKLWRIDPIFKCPVIGTSLTLSEQKQILKKTGLSAKKKSTYEIHEILVAHSDSENRISKKADTLLHRKYGQKISGWLALDNQNFTDAFKTAFESGDTSFAIWAAGANPNLNTESKREIFGLIHMAMHRNGEERARDRAKLFRSRKVLEDLREKLKNATRYGRTLERKNCRLEQEFDALKASMTAHATQTQKGLKPDVKKKVYEPENLELKNRLLEEKYNSALSQLEKTEGRLNATAVIKEKLTAELELQLDLNRRLREEIPRLLRSLKELTDCESACASFNLCKKRILMVGGITRMESLYRELIEGSGGIFEYHDGYMNRGVKTLETRLKRADMVLCPVSCNSHAACSIVKNLAKKHSKRVHMLANSSLSTLSQAIWSAEGRV